MTQVENEDEEEEEDEIQDEVAEQIEKALSEKSNDSDIYKINSDGDPVNPIELTDANFVDVARIEAGGSFGA